MFRPFKETATIQHGLGFDEGMAKLKRMRTNNPRRLSLRIVNEESGHAQRESLGFYIRPDEDTALLMRGSAEETLVDFFTLSNPHHAAMAALRLGVTRIEAGSWIFIVREHDAGNHTVMDIYNLDARTEDYPLEPLGEEITIETETVDHICEHYTVEDIFQGKLIRLTNHLSVALGRVERRVLVMNGETLAIDVMRIEQTGQEHPQYQPASSVADKVSRATQAATYSKLLGHAKCVEVDGHPYIVVPGVEELPYGVARLEYDTTGLRPENALFQDDQILGAGAPEGDAAEDNLPSVREQMFRSPIGTAQVTGSTTARDPLTSNDTQTTQEEMTMNNEQTNDSAVDNEEARQEYIRALQEKVNVITGILAKSFQFMEAAPERSANGANESESLNQQYRRQQPPHYGYTDPKQYVHGQQGYAPQAPVAPLMHAEMDSPLLSRVLSELSSHQGYEYALLDREILVCQNPDNEYLIKAQMAGSPVVMKVKFEHRGERPPFDMTVINA